MAKFHLVSPYSPTGDQPRAIDKLVAGFRAGNQFETLLGVTGSGKTFTMANVINELGLPTLVISHNKTLAAQLYSEFKEFFPDNAVEYFVSYYDYYQPEAYIPSTDTYIEKDSAVNDEIDRLRHSATAALSERDDVIIVASVSCIYGLGSPVDYKNMTLSFRPGQVKDMRMVLRRLVDMQYVRNEFEFKRGSFRVKGDTLEICPANSYGEVYRIEFFDDEVERICLVEYITGRVKAELKHCIVFPASHYVVSGENMERALKAIMSEMEERVGYFTSRGRLIEAQRIAERTRFDVEIMRETGVCSGIENYSRHLFGFPPGAPPYTLLDYFPDEMLLIVDESHITLPQLRGMYAGDHSRKSTLAEYGFRLPSALDNRPLNFEEFEDHINQLLFVSATPGPYEEEHELMRAEQIIRPTGLLDPIVEVHPTRAQIDDLTGEIKQAVSGGGKVLVTTLTKKMAEELTSYLADIGIRVRYLHSDIDTLKRSEIIRDLRLNEFDVLIGINLLREGLDIPEISLICILDADKEGFLRSATSLIQTIGRAARNADGRVIMYADRITDSMKTAIDETDRRRKLQAEYNASHGITPETIHKAVREVMTISRAVEAEAEGEADKDIDLMSERELRLLYSSLNKRMRKAAAELNFEEAIRLRDRLAGIRAVMG